MPAPARPGLFSGWIGIALVAARLGKILQDENLLRAALRVVQRCQREKLENWEFDFILGKAGTVVGLLILREMLNVPGLLDVCLMLARKLLNSAKKSKVGYSWPCSAMPTSRNLTGFAHGAAGIGYALLELFKPPAMRSIAMQPKQPLPMSAIGMIPSRAIGPICAKPQANLDRVATRFHSRLLGATVLPASPYPGCARTKFSRTTPVGPRREWPWKQPAAPWNPGCILPTQIILSAMGSLETPRSCAMVLRSWAQPLHNLVKPRWMLPLLESKLSLAATMHGPAALQPVKTQA